MRTEELRVIRIINMGYPFVSVKAGKMGCGLREVFNWTYSNDREHLRKEEGGSKMAVFVVPCSNLLHQIVF